MRADPRRLRAYVGRATADSLPWPAPHFFRGPIGQTHIAIPK